MAAELSSSGWRKPVGSSTRPWGCSSASWPAACRSPRRRTPITSTMCPTGPTTCARCWARSTSRMLQAFGAVGPTPCPLGAARRGVGRRGHGLMPTPAELAESTPASSPRSSSTSSGCSGAGACWPTCPSPTSCCWCPVAGDGGPEHPAPTAGDPELVVLGQMRPTNRPTLVDQDLVGQTVNESQWSLAAAACTRARWCGAASTTRSWASRSRSRTSRSVSKTDIIAVLLRVSLAPLVGPRRCTSGPTSTSSSAWPTW